MAVPSSYALNHLERHDIGWLRPTLLSRRESTEYTLDLLDMMDRDRNVSLLSRATHLYKATQDTFESLREALIRTNEFVHVEILHETSDLGIPFKILAKHSNGRQIMYDGVQFHLSRMIHPDGFNLQDVGKLASYYDTGVEVVLWPFENTLRTVLPNLPDFTFPSYFFYTAEVTDWENLGIHNDRGQAHLRLVCRDSNVFIITGLNQAETGKDYHLYLGDSNTAVQMIAHEEYQAMEIDAYADYFRRLRARVRQTQVGTEREAKALVLSAWKLREKTIQWNKVKEEWEAVRKVFSRLPHGDLLVQAYEDLIGKKWSFFNTPKQLFLAGEIRDEQEQIAYPVTGFFQANALTLQDGDRMKIMGITGVSDGPTRPQYNERVEELVALLGTLKEEIPPVLEDQKTLLGMFQTEFSLYALWFAIIAVFISVIAIIVTIFMSRAAAIAP